MKILELANYSAGICGVWQRVKQESIELAKKSYKVMVFSSNAIKGSEKLAASKEKIGNIEIRRFPFKKLGGESFMYWLRKDAEKEAINYSPDIIITHNYRHLHTTKALKIKKILEKKGKKCKVFLVTHAPFARESTRNFFQNIAVNIYDFLIGKNTLNQFDRIIAITKWERPYLERLGVKKEKIIYIPNGIPEEFFKLKKQVKEINKILFLGRISPIKNIEVLIQAMKFVNKNVILEIVGSAEEDYKKKLENLVISLNLSDKIIFKEPVYNLKDKIILIDSSKIFVLPSKSEGMPQSIIEAMARGKIVIGSNIPAIKDIIKYGKNGYLFDLNNPRDLARKIDLALQENKKNKRIRNKARDFVRQFSWGSLARKIECLF